GAGRDSGNGRFQVFGPSGKYRRTILPRPAGLPLERVKPLGEMVLESGERFPTCLLPQYAARHNQVPVVAPNGDLVFVNGRRRGKHPEGKRFQSVGHTQQWPRRLLRLAADGGSPGAGYLGPLLGKGFETGPVYLAMSADGKTVYVSGARHAVFRCEWGEKAELLPAAGSPDKAGAGRSGLKDPCGILVDAEGRLYVADRGNHRIACFGPGGKLLGAIPVEWPLALAVDPGSGAIYAACGYKNYTLFKFDSLQARKPSAEMPLGTGWPILALDSQGGRRTLYVANVGRRDARAGKSWSGVIRLKDGPRGLTEAGEISDPEVPLQPQLLGADRERDLVYGLTGIFGFCVRWDGRSGRMEKVPMLLHPKANGIKGMTAGASGTVALHAQGEHGRMDAGMVPLPFDTSGTYIARLPQEDCPRSFYDRGSCIAPADGSLYHVHERGGYMKPMRVMAINRDGTTKKDSIVTFETRSAAAVRVDNAGNIYVLDHLKPVGKPVPDAFSGKVKVQRHNRFVYNYGSVIKFRPEGGVVKEMSKGAPAPRKLGEGEIQFTTAEGRGDFVSRGAQWAWYGVSMIQPALGRGGYCMCWHPRFDVDGYARVFVPDQLRCRVVVLDTNGNEITSIGRYGNVDDRGPGVPLADPRTVMVTDRTAYIGDMSNNRVARAELRYARTASCPVVLETEPDPLPAAVLAVRDEVAGLSPRLARTVDWRVLADDLGEASGKQEAVRAAACRAAGRAGDVAVLGALIKSKSGRVRLAAVWSL
ncbi:MAG: NHL repeat-containing protein, partial [Planctomycetota bacterium]